MGSISKKNADKNNAESTDNGKSAEEISDIQAYQTTLQNCANLAKKLDTKAAAVFKDADYIAKLGGIMATRYKDTSARYEALKRAIADPTKSKEMQKLQSEGVTIEQVEARFQQFEKQFDILEKTKNLKTDFVAKSGDNTIFSKNVAFAKFKFTTKGSKNNPNNPPKSYELDLIAISGDNGEKFMKKVFGEPVEVFSYGNKQKVRAYKYNDFYVLEDVNALRTQHKDKMDWDAGLDQSQDANILGYNGADSERKMTIFADGVVNNAGDGTRASIVIETEMSPCDRCSNVVENLAEKNKNLLDAKIEFGVYFKQPISVDDRTLGDKDSKFMATNSDIST